MIPTQKYKNFLTDLIRRHMLILGPNIARDVAMQTQGIEIDSSGAVINLVGDPLLVINELISGYNNLCAPVTQLSVYQLLEKYPDIRIAYNQPITNINLACSLTEQESSQPV